MAILLIISLVYACAREDAELTVTLGSADAAAAAEAERVLKERFAAFMPPLSGLESDVRGDRLRFTFDNGAPDPEVLTYLTRTAGRLRATQLEGDVESTLFTSEDVMDARVESYQGEPVLMIRLSEDAVQRLSRMWQPSAAKVMRIRLDEEPLAQARFSKRPQRVFGIGAPDSVPLSRVAAVLRSGPLPVAAEGARIDRP